MGVFGCVVSPGRLPATILRQDAMRLIVLHKGAMIDDVISDSETLYVGSAEGNRVQLNNPRLPDRIAVVFPEDETTWYIETLTDKLEVFVGTTRLTQRRELKTGDEVRIFDYSMRVYPEHSEKYRVPTQTTQAQLERFAQSTLPPGAVVRKPEEPLTVAPEHLPRVGEATVQASRCSTIEELMEVTLQALISNFGARRAWVGVRRSNRGPLEYVEGRLLTGEPLDLPKAGDDLKPRILDRAQFIRVPILSTAERMSILCGPLIGPHGPIGMVYLDTGESRRRFKEKDLNLFVLQLHIYAQQFAGIFRSLVRVREAMIDGAVSVAHEIQARLTPRKLPQWDELQFGALREPGRERTGDVYDVLRLSNNLAYFMIAQTSATGSLPSMLMTQSRTAFRVAGMHQDTAAIFLRSLNWLLYDGLKDHPLDCFAGVVDPATGQMRYSVAGHIGAYVIGAHGEPRKLGVSEPLPALGMSKNTVYPLLPEQLESGETVALFTAGVTTAQDSAGKTFGQQRILNLLCDGFGQQASTMLKEMHVELRNSTEQGSQPDDITVLLAHRV